MPERKRVYLDNAATSPLDPEVLEAMMPFLTEKFGNPSSIHQYGRETRAAIEKARKTVARYLNASPGEIFFTSGGTESSNTILNCAVRDLGVKRIITSHIEHHCVLHPVKYLERHQAVQVDFVSLHNDGSVDYEHLETLLREKSGKTLVALMHANNEIGVVTDILKVGSLCREYKALFFSDTVQSVTHFPLDLQEIPVDFITGSAHKFYGPKGTGFMYVRSDAMIRPMLQGGAQERNLRAGTENLYGIVGLGKAFELGCERMEDYKTHIEGLRRHMVDRLIAEFPGMKFNSPLEGDYLYTVLNISCPPSPIGDILIYNLDIAGIAASSGSACSSGSNVGSHVLSALGKDPKRTAVRFSFSKFNTIEEIEYAIDQLKQFIPAGNIMAG